MAYVANEVAHVVLSKTGAKLTHNTLELLKFDDSCVLLTGELPTIQA
jgi:hypothetical protein